MSIRLPLDSAMSKYYYVYEWRIINIIFIQTVNPDYSKASLNISNTKSNITVIIIHIIIINDDDGRTKFITLHWWESNAFSAIFAFFVCKLQTTLVLINERIYSIAVCHIVAFTYFTIYGKFRLRLTVFVIIIQIR